MEICNKQFERLCEIASIREMQERNTDIPVKRVHSNVVDEFKWHEEMQAKVDAYEKENGKRLYNPNR